MRLTKKLAGIFIFISLVQVCFYCFAEDKHALFTQILQSYVYNGLVDYKELCMDNRLEQYIKQLANTDPASLASDKERKAFWINAYNAYTVKIISDAYPIDSINELHTGGLIFARIIKKTIWDKKIIVINNRKISLNDIENQLFKVGIKDPRVHFALVNATMSAPPLRPEAYEAERIDWQLDEQTRVFLMDRTRNSFDTIMKRAKLSPVFSQYSRDFGRNTTAVLEYIGLFLPRDLSETIFSETRSWKVEYEEYNWELNDCRRGR